jgi:type I restriction enzyme M protein
VAELEPYQFFGSDLDVLDAAFEHLINPEQKGDKGQYFTPRHVVRMCVEMLNPRQDETCLDPACGAPRGAVLTIPERRKKKEVRHTTSRVSGIPQCCRG